jgi:hypothetical protein
VAFATAGDDGTYQLNATPGVHAVCVDAGKIYLDPCHWSSGSSAVITSFGSHLDLPLAKGVLVLARISDPNGIVQAVRSASPLLGKTAGPLVWATVTDQSGVTRTMWPVQLGNRVSEFALAVPPNQPFTINVGSAQLGLADASGVPLPQNIFNAYFTSPAADASYVAPSFMGHRIGPGVPSTRFDFVVTGPGVP